MEFVLTLHSIVRWLLVFVAVAALIKLGMGWLKKQPFDKAASALTGAFGGLMDLQLTLGLIFLIWNGMILMESSGVFASRQRWEHLSIMLIAVVVGHLPAMWKKKEDTLRYRNTFFAVLAATLLVIVGVSLLPNNRWLTITGLF